MTSPFIDRPAGSRYERRAAVRLCEKCGREHYDFADCPPEPADGETGVVFRPPVDYTVQRTIERTWPASCCVGTTRQIFDNSATHQFNNNPRLTEEPGNGNRR